MSSLFASVAMAPRDPILGLTEQYVADSRPNKVNLGVGVYYDDAGRIPLLKAVRAAEEERVKLVAPRGYQPIDGNPGYNKAVQELLFGHDSDLVRSGRLVTAQALGGTGALKIGADFLRQLLPGAKVAISDPSWENHRALFEAAGFEVVSYPYYDPATQGLRFDAMLAGLRALPAQTVVVLHACCHNPTGVDLTDAQWEQVVQVVKDNHLTPFLDIAYQGFGDGLLEDAAAVRLFAASGLSVFISSSFSKSFSLYGERVGALTLITGSADEAKRTVSQLKRVIRTNYSSPPTHGGAVVATVLSTPDLRQMWEDELADMRNRIRAMRHDLVQRLQHYGAKRDFDFVIRQRGMFSYTGLTEDQVNVLREQHGIYVVNTGRICVAALNSGNIDTVAKAIAAVL